MHDGKQNGFGVETWKDGGSYQGHFKNGCKDGNGKFTWANGCTYGGGYKDGKIEGHGVFTNVERNEKYTG